MTSSKRAVTSVIVQQADASHGSICHMSTVQCHQSVDDIDVTSTVHSYVFIVSNSSPIPSPFQCHCILFFFYYDVFIKLYKTEITDNSVHPQLVVFGWLIITCDFCLTGLLFAITTVSGAFPKEHFGAAGATLRVRHGTDRQTDRQTYEGHQHLMLRPVGAGHNKIMLVVGAELKVQVKLITHRVNIAHTFFGNK